MHEYYNQKRDRLHRTMDGFLSLAGPELERAGGEGLDAILPKCWDI